MKYFFGILLPGFIFIFSAFPVIAASITIDVNQSEIKAEDFLTAQVKLSISAKDDTAYYLRGVFYQPGTIKYCGYTWNGGDWFSGPYSSSSNQGWKNFLKVVIKSASWSGEMKIKVDPQDSGCKESGNYGFKVQRFTESGSSIFDPQQEKYIDIIIPTLTPVPTDVPVSTNAPTNVPTALPTVKPTLTVKPTIKITPTIAAKNKSDKNKKEIILKNKDKKNKPSPVPSISKKTAVLGASTSGNLIAKVFIGVGVILLITCAILAFRSYKKSKTEII